MEEIKKHTHTLKYAKQENSDRDETNPTATLTGVKM